jgi:hypothetical protein
LGLKFHLFAEHPDEFLDNAPAELWPVIFTTPQSERYPDFIAVFEEAERAAGFDLEVMLAGLQSQADAFDLTGTAAFTLLCDRLGLLILEFAPIEQFCDGRIGVGGNLGQIVSFVLGTLQRLGKRDDSDLLTIGTDQAHVGGADVMVETKFLGQARSSLLNAKFCE